MEFERPLMKLMIGKKIVVWGHLVFSLLHLFCLTTVPYMNLLEDFRKSHEESLNQNGLSAKDLCIWHFLYIPLLSIYLIILKRIKPFLLKRILEDQSLTTAFKMVEEPDLESATPQVVGTEIHSVATWLLTKVALLFWALGCVIIYKEYRYIPMVSLLPVGWFLITSGYLFFVCFQMNCRALEFTTKRMEKIQATNS